MKIVIFTACLLGVRADESDRRGLCVVHCGLVGELEEDGKELEKERFQGGGCEGKLKGVFRG